jgi:outer membrane protein assembly factor BamD (BamD/ComL family)
VHYWNRFFASLLICSCALTGKLAAADDNVRLLNGALRQASRGDTTTALQVIDRYLGQPGREPAKAYALYLKGMLLDGQGMTDSAQTCLRTSIVSYPGSDWIGQSLTRLGLILGREGRDTAAVRVIEPVAGSYPDSTFTLTALIGLGNSAGRAGIESRALDAYLQYLNSENNEQHMTVALQRSAELLVSGGRAEEALWLLGKIEEVSSVPLAQQDLPMQIVAIGALTGLGMPDSALRVVEEIRRNSGDSPLRAPRLLFLIGQAHLARDEFSSADSVLLGLAENDNLTREGVPPDSLYRLLMEISHRRGDMDSYFWRAAKVIELTGNHERAFELLDRIVSIGEQTGMLEHTHPSLNAYATRSDIPAQSFGLALLHSRLALFTAGADSALSILGNPVQTVIDPKFAARISLERARLNLAGGDTLRAGAMLRDYLADDDDPLHNKDSLLLSFAEIQRIVYGTEAEASLLKQLVAQYPATSFWNIANERLEEIRLFESARPAEAATELLDIYINQAGQVPGARLAEIAADKLVDYERALAIMQREDPQDDAGRLRLIRYKFLSALRLLREGSFEGNERLAQAWREIRMLAGSGNLSSVGEKTLETYHEILQRMAPTLRAGELAEAETELLTALGWLETGIVRAGILHWLAGRYLVHAEADTGMAVMVLADSARAMWSEAASIAGGGSIGASATFRLAEALENAAFAGARDSAASLYKKLVDTDSEGRWGSLAGLRLGAIHLAQERQFLAYRTISLWGERHPYAVEDIRYRMSLAEASFLTNRFSRAVSLMNAMLPGELDTRSRRRFDAYRIRALVAMGEYGRATARLANFRANYHEPESGRIASVLACELYYVAGSPELADSYREMLKDTDGYEELVELFALQARLRRGGDKKTLDRLRKDFEDFRDAPWNQFFRIDVAFQAYRGIMACHAATAEPDKAAEARDNFRRRYPERRAALAVLMLDDIVNYLKAGNLQKAGSLYDDLGLLFGDVFPEDRMLWIGWRLARERADVAEANRNLTALAEKYPWSKFGKMARVELLRLYLAAGRADLASSLLESVEPGAELRADQYLGALASIAGAQNHWDEALDLHRRQWAAVAGLNSGDEAVVLWAEAAVRAGRVSEALEVLSSFWSDDPNLTARARLLLAEQYKTAGKVDNALDALDGIATLTGPRGEPTLEALYRRGLLLEQAGLIKEALTTYRQLEQLAGQNSDWLRSARNRIRELQSQMPPDSTSQQASP